MKYRIKYTPSANKDLRNIQIYISQELNNPASASRLISKILQKCESLALFPEGSSIRFSPYNKPVRLLNTTNYIIAYTVNKQKRIVYIRAIVYNRRNLPQIISSRI